MGKRTKKRNDSLFGSQNTQVAVVNISVPVRTLIKPKKYASPELMLPAIEGYFNTCDRDGRKYTVEGLALALGFVSTEGLRTYGTDEGYSQFHDLIKSAKLKIQMQRVEDLQSGNLNPLAAIFLLANCHKADYKRDPDSKALEAGKIESFLFDYEKPKEDNDKAGNEAEADGQAG
jgi:hypothetical protein